MTYFIFELCVYKEKNTDNDKSEGENSKSSEDGGSKEDSKSDSESSGESSNDSSSKGKSKGIEKYNVQSNGILNNSNKEIDWNSLKSDIEIINMKWSEMIISLHQLNVNNDDILSFSNLLNQLTINIKNENKKDSLINLANLYSFIPNYTKQISSEQEKISLLYIKSNVLNSYALVEQERWDEVKNVISTAIENVTTIMNNVNNNENSRNKISKLYVVLNEMNNIIDLKDKDLYYIKYKNVMEILIY